VALSRSFGSSGRRASEYCRRKSYEAVSARRPSGLKTALVTPVGVALENGQGLAGVGIPKPRGSKACHGAKRRQPAPLFVQGDG
jgi:hypothetical protein